ncbi:caspase family protein [Catellatospora sp. IY07-71]|uniref:caspase family protein n=1 Tax=Catellatospora sp. IY07-71 TaxID=2728827 RepID=UPI001BB34598|nr:caspase family protein [Catellatospora sp. IY07-71]
MARSALLIGPRTGDLQGVGNDVQAMATALRAWDFDITPCVGDDATRAGILAAYEQLIAEAEPDDAIVVFYSGHGGYCLPPEHERTASLPSRIQFIVPSDFDESQPGDFRGITDLELSGLLARLTERTRNVTVVLDCCHAAHMSRDPDRIVKALSVPASYALLSAHLDRVGRQDPAFRQRLAPEGNPDAVRVVACAPEQSAYEYAVAAGRSMGMLTEALTGALTEARDGGLTVSWATVVDRVRTRVLTKMPTQRPEVEGPARRMLFERTETDTVATLPVSAEGSRLKLAGALLLGVRPGDEFVIMPPDSAGPDERSKLGDVQVEKIVDGAAWGRFRPRQPDTAVPLGACAHRSRVAAPALPVRVPGSDPRCADLVRAMSASALVRVAEPGERADVEVRIDEAGALTVHDRIGPLHLAARADAPGIARVVQDLKRLAQAQMLRRLAEEPGGGLAAPLEVEFGVVRSGTAHPAAPDRPLYLDEPVYVKVRNGGPDVVWVSLLDIGVAARIALLNTSSPSGVRLVPGGEFVLGRDDRTGELPGARLEWPEGLDRGGPRPETIVVLATSKPVDMRVIEQHGLARGGSALEGFLDQLRTGLSRDVVPPTPSGLRFAVRTIDFELVPVLAPPGEEPVFQVDERPGVTGRFWRPRGAAPAAVAVRLSDLVVHHNRAFREADIRIDTVLTTAGPGGRPAYQAHTERFRDIRDGQRLPLDDLQVFHGPVDGYLDVAVWVSRDDRESLALSDLLAQTLTDAELQAAMGQVGTLLVAAPQAAVAIAAVGAGAVIVNAAYRLLRGAHGNSIGLYRTTLLAGENFGVGRSPGRTAVRAQDFSFRYRVEEVAAPSVSSRQESGRDVKEGTRV